jgi:hypothetical protein
MDDAGIADHVLYHQDLTGENIRQPRAILRFKALGEALNKDMTRYFRRPRSRAEI